MPIVLSSSIFDGVNDMNEAGNRIWHFTSYLMILFFLSFFSLYCFAPDQYNIIRWLICFLNSRFAQNDPKIAQN